MEVAVIAILLLMSYFIWHIEMHVTLIGIISILINTLGMFGIGLIVGGLTIRLKRVGALTFIIQMGLLFITDTIPTSSTVLLISRCIPLTLCNDVLRTSISGGDVLMPFLELICVSLLWVVIGNVLFKLCIGRAKKKGNLLFY